VSEIDAALVLLESRLDKLTPALLVVAVASDDTPLLLESTLLDPVVDETASDRVGPPTTPARLGLDEVAPGLLESMILDPIAVESVPDSIGRLIMPV
jgi:hypothetical protein